MKTVGLFGLMLGAAALAGAQADYPGATWNPADATNQTTSNRPITYPLQYIIIHVTEGTFAGAVGWFKNATSDVSAHYVVRSSDGFIYQMVRNKDIAWHAGNSPVNARSIGIEHEAITTGSNPTSWFTDAMYRSSADLTRWLTTTYGIPRTHDPNQTPTTDVTQIAPGLLGHKQVRVGGTSCPSIYWDWDYYMSLVNRGATYDSDTMPTYLSPGQQVEVIVRMTNTSDFTWTRAAGNNQVTLRTTPAGRTSNFFVSGNWISNSQICLPTVDVAPNATGEFRFQWLAPMTPGTYTETLRLHQSAAGEMGPELSFNIGVGQIDKVIDNSSTAFATSGGTWSSGTSSIDKYGTDYRFFQGSKKTGAYSEWMLNVPTSGTYGVYAWWPAGTNRSSEVTYEIRGRRDTFLTTVNQQINGGTWNFLGKTSLNAGGGFVRVKALSNMAGVVMADAVRVVGPTR